jgi:CheY-like chemotaxis protein
MRVLIADDDRDTVMTLGILLRSEGHETWLVQKGAEVAQAVRDFKPAIVLLDLGMPDRSGYEVAAELFRDYGASCPVLIAVSGRSGAADKQKAETSGFHHFIPKPYDPEVLLSLVARK